MIYQPSCDHDLQVQSTDTQREFTIIHWRCRWCELGIDEVRYGFWHVSQSHRKQVQS